MRYSSYLENLVKLYKNSHTIDSNYKDSFTSSVDNKDRLPIKIINIQTILNTRCDFTVVKKFITRYGEVYILPIHDLVAIRAFFFRAIKEKDFRIISDGRIFFYGLHRFKAFRYNNTIFLSEGIKDAEAVALYYPYSLALLTNRLSYNQKEVLKRLSNNIVYIHDSDYYGRKGGISVGKNIKLLSNPFGKDLGEIFDTDCKDKQAMQIFIKSAIKNYSNVHIDQYSDSGGIK